MTWILALLVIGAWIDLARRTRQIMTTGDEVKALVGEIKTKVGKVGKDVQVLIDKLTTPGGLSEAEALELKGELEGVRDRLTAIDDQTPDEVEPPNGGGN